MLKEGAKLQRMQEMMAGLVEALSPEDGVCLDLGDNVLAAMIAGVPREQCIGGTGALGGAVSVAIGHAVANDSVKGEIFCIIGDGGFGLHLNSLVTAYMNRHLIRRLTIIVLNDMGWGMTGRQRTTPSALGVDYAAFGRSLGLPMSKNVYSREELREACLEAKKTLGIKLIVAYCAPLK